MKLKWSTILGAIIAALQAAITFIFGHSDESDAE